MLPIIQNRYIVQGKRLFCLVVRSFEKLDVFTNAMSKTRSVPSVIRMSSVATQNLLSLSGKMIVKML